MPTTRPEVVALPPFRTTTSLPILKSKVSAGALRRGFLPASPAELVCAGADAAAWGAALTSASSAALDLMISPLATSTEKKPAKEKKGKEPAQDGAPPPKKKQKA